MRDSNKHYLTAKKESREQAVFTKWLRSRLGKHSFKHYKAFIDKFGCNADAKLAIAINTLSEYNGLNFKELVEEQIGYRSGIYLTDFRSCEIYHNTYSYYTMWVHKIYGVSQEFHMSNIPLYETLLYLGMQQSYFELNRYTLEMDNDYKFLCTLVLRPEILNYISLGLTTEEILTMIDTLYASITIKEKNTLQQHLLWAFIGYSEFKVNTTIR